MSLKFRQTKLVKPFGFRNLVLFLKMSRECNEIWNRLIVCKILLHPVNMETAELLYQSCVGDSKRTLIEFTKQNKEKEKRNGLTIKEV